MTSLQKLTNVFLASTYRPIQNGQVKIKNGTHNIAVTAAIQIINSNTIAMIVMKIFAPM